MSWALTARRLEEAWGAGVKSNKQTKKAHGRGPGEVDDIGARSTLEQGPHLPSLQVTHKHSPV